MTVFFLLTWQIVSGQFSLSGRVLNKQKSEAITGATVNISETDQWAVTDKDGKFSIGNIPSGRIVVKISSLDYVTMSYELLLNQSIDTVFHLSEDNLTLEKVVVTATIDEKDLATTYTIDRKALDQLQMLSVNDAMSLLPGRKTNLSQHLASGAQTLSVNGFGGEGGNPVFGVAVEVDNVRLSNNALPNTEGAGVDVRNIATTNVESIEVVTGIPSVEYGDMTNGLVKINTRKGASPYIIDMATKPNTKQLAVSKGFEIGPNGSVLNMNAEYTKSVSNIASPYTSYDRNGLSLNYSTIINRKKTRPLSLTLGISGNAGGLDSKSDPDLFVNTYSKTNDGVVRSNIAAKWLLRKKWITNLEFTAGVNYNNQQNEVSANKSGSSSVAAIHTTEQGYHVGQTYEQNPNADILLIAPGYWYELRYNDSRALNYSASLKANWAKKFERAVNNIKVGANYTGSKNLGRGQYYADPRHTPTWREYRYDQESIINNYGLYVEDHLKVFTESGYRSYFQLTGGLRSDITDIKSSEYGVVSSLSPRVNAGYTFWENDKEKIVTDFSVRAGWGKSVKLPSLGILHPVPNYFDVLTFAPGTTASGEIFYAYYTQPHTRLFNPNLKWQSNIQKEVTVNFKIAGNSVTIVASQGNTHNAFGDLNIYTPFTYKFTDQSDLEGSEIPISNRRYSVDKTTGVVTVSDMTGVLPSETLGYRSYSRFYTNEKPINNNSPLSRKSLSWIIDFKQFKSLRTSFRLDGSYYTYNYIDEQMAAYSSSQIMADGNPYKYVGYVAGGNVSANGRRTRSLNTNLTAITHIPAIRMVLSARIETSLYNYSQRLSESPNGERSIVLDDQNSYIPSQTMTDIYGSNRFVGMYPEYYVSLDDMSTPIPFKEKFLWAKDNDAALYNELAKLVIKSNTNYFFMPNRTSAYYTANISATKEIGNTASISFNATNFLNNMSLIRNSASDTESSIYDSSSIIRFYYGLSLRLKFK